jgi:hypothetical protein
MVRACAPGQEPVFYRKVDSEITRDASFQQLSTKPSAQALYLYLLIGQHNSPLPGLINFGSAALAERLRWPPRDFIRCFDELTDAGLVDADWKARVIWIKGALRPNHPTSVNMVKGYRRWWAAIPDCALKYAAHAAFVDMLAPLVNGAAYVATFIQCCPPLESGSGSGSRSKNRTRSGTGYRTGFGTEGGVKEEGGKNNPYLGAPQPASRGEGPDGEGMEGLSVAIEVSDGHSRHAASNDDHRESLDAAYGRATSRGDDASDTRIEAADEPASSAAVRQDQAEARAQGVEGMLEAALISPRPDDAGEARVEAAHDQANPCSARLNHAVGVEEAADGLCRGAGASGAAGAGLPAGDALVAMAADVSADEGVAVAAGGRT